MEWLWGGTASVQDRRSPFPLGMGSRHGSLRVQAARLARSIAEASDAGWECLAVTPYRLKSDGDASTVEEYLLLLWRER